MGSGENLMRVLVTGGGGFLGKRIITLLLNSGIEVSSFSRKLYPELVDLGVTSVCGNLQDLESVEEAVGGCDVVFHVAAKVGLHGAFQDFYQANVIGSKNIVNSCLKHGIEKLVYTSSPSVVFDGHDHEGIDESTPYPDRYYSHYQATKAEAEQFVLNANSQELAVVSLRPHLIWGPGDPHLMPRIVQSSKEGKLKIIGNGENLVDTVFIDNAAKAHLLAMEKLSAGSPVAGKVYFITNQEPWPIKKLINQILATGGQAPLDKHIPVSIAYPIGFLLEKIYQIFRLRGEPRLTRLIIRQLSKAHWYDPAKANQELGYFPEISMDKGFELLRQAQEKLSSK
jgi:2-alkyl-3-oxoalkanoate reductase